MVISNLKAYTRVSELCHFLISNYLDTKNPLDESERGERKSWLKAQHSENEDHGIWSHHFMENRWGNSDRLLFGGAPKSLHMVTVAMKLKDSCSWKKSYDQPSSILKSRDITLP